MNYVKKMCILRQIKQGFSGDGKTLSGLIKIEQYGKNLAVEVSVVNFAPLALGEYYCLLSDGKGKTEMLSLRGKSYFNLLSDIDISDGFCGILCYVKSDVVPIAYGINGKGAYDWKAILSATLPPVFPQNDRKAVKTEIAESMETEQHDKNEPPMSALSDEKPEKFPDPFPIKSIYDDESVANENYYEKEQNNEQEQSCKACENACFKNADQSEQTAKRGNETENGNADCVFHPFEKDPDGYYLSVKSEIDDLFITYPQDTTLRGAFSCSEWVRIKGEETAPQYLVGVIYEEGKARYICYALAAKDKNNPPEEIRGVCSFVPCSAISEEGFFVIFQSAATGECIKPERA